MRFDTFIEAEKAAGRSIARCFYLFQVSRSAYYQRRNGKPSKRVQQDALVTASITQIHKESKGTYGVIRVLKTLKEQRPEIGKTKVARLMGRAGLEGKTKRRWKKTTVVDPEAEKAKDLIHRDFAPSAEINERYVGDITYISTQKGWVYLATVIDLASRRVVGWALENHMRTPLITSALDMAFVQRKPPPGIKLHSDRGCQYTSQEYGDFARMHGAVLSVGMAGECWDNAVAESFFATIKRELLDTQKWQTREHVYKAVFEYIEGWYNTRRLHSSLGYMSPAKYEESILGNSPSKAA